MPTRAARLAHAMGLILLATAPLSAARAQGPGKSTRYDADYFARSQPSSALDMVNLVPGFRLEEGDKDVRGYAGAGGNILLDGQRPASKQDSLQDVLKRIPARAVHHVELIRSGAAGYDMQGYAVIVNVVRAHSARLSGRVEAGQALYRHGYDAPRLAGELRYGRDDKVLDLSGALYREIDDEHGFGLRDRHAADGSPIRLARYDQPEGADIKEASASYRQPLAGGTLRVNGLFKRKEKFANISDRISFPESFDALGTERSTADATEFGLNFDRPVAERSRIELIGIRRTERDRETDRSIDPDGTAVTREKSDSSETILRAVLRRQGSLVSLETGIEGALNTLDNHSALEENGVDIPLPTNHVRVQEKRAELFAISTWHLSPVFSAEAGARFEMSRLTQSGDSRLGKSLSFLKPRMLLRWTPSPRDEFRLLVERAVGQLDFDNFVSSASLTSNSITAGNKDLEPDRLWRAELAWEHHIGDGALVLTARREAISDVVDHIPVVTPDDVFDAVGNIGKGRRTMVLADLNLPLDRYGLKGVTIQANGLYRHSRVTDPTTGERRRISKDLPVEGTAGFTHDIAALNIRWGANYALGKEEASFKIDAVEVDRLSDRLDMFVEYKPSPRWTIRLFGKNLTDSPAVRTRTIHTGLRDAAPIKYVERRVLDSGPYVGLTIQRAFGG